MPALILRELHCMEEHFTTSLLDAVAPLSVRTFANQPFLKLICFTKVPSEGRVGGSQNIKLACTDYRKLEHGVNTKDYSTDILTKSQLRSKSCMSLKSSENPPKILLL